MRPVGMVTRCCQRPVEQHVLEGWTQSVCSQCGQQAPEILSSKECEVVALKWLNKL